MCTCTWLNQQELDIIPVSHHVTLSYTQTSGVEGRHLNGSASLIDGYDLEKCYDTVTVLCTKCYQVWSSSSSMVYAI